MILLGASYLNKFGYFGKGNTHMASLKTKLQRLFDTFEKECFQIKSFHRDQRDFTKNLLNGHYPLTKKLSREKSKMIEVKAKKVTLVLAESGREVDVSKKEFELLCSVVSDRTSTIEKYPRLVNIMLLVYLVALFDAFLLDSIKAIMSQKRELLRSSKHLTYEKLLGFKNITDLHSYIVDNEIIELSYRSFIDQCQFIEDKFGIDTGGSGVKIEEIAEIIAARNLWVHNKGIVNQVYKEAIPDSQFSIGDERVITDSYLDESFNRIRIIAEFLHKSFTHKFCTDKWTGNITQHY